MYHLNNDCLPALYKTVCPKYAVHIEKIERSDIFPVCTEVNQINSSEKVCINTLESGKQNR
jgi:hypothetical protein